MNKLRRLFCPTPEEEIEDLNRIILMHNEQISCCSTCGNYEGSTMPGFVTDYGRCKVNSSVFITKILNERTTTCDKYVENVSVVEEIKKRIQNLRKGIEP